MKKEICKKRTAQERFEETLSHVETLDVRPRLLLHACCAPCASHVLMCLDGYFDVTVYFYNPNIVPREEYEFRCRELRRLIREMPLQGHMEIITEEYDPEPFYRTAAGGEEEREGGERCRRCYSLRLTETAKRAAEGGFDYFATTLTVSPHKRAEWINEIGDGLAEQHGVSYLPSDFKKKNGYKHSCELSAQYDLYRQNYCGCEFSKRDSLGRKG